MHTTLMGEWHQREMYFLVNQIYAQQLQLHSSNQHAGLLARIVLFMTSTVSIPYQIQDKIWRDCTWIRSLERMGEISQMRKSM